MSNFLVPNTFVPGTKAKAQDVNENFSAVQNEINLKAEKTGDINQTFTIAPATEEHHAITKGQVETIINDSVQELQKDIATPFCIEQGYTDENGNPAIISAEGTVINFNVDDGTTYGSIVATPANNQPKFIVKNLNSIDVSSYTDGTYNVFVNNEETAYLLNNTIYVQKSTPTEPTLNCIFEDTSKLPISVKKFNGTEWELFNDVHLGSIVISGGAITKIINQPFNDNWANKMATTISTASSTRPAVVVENYANGNSWYRVYSDGWCEQGGKLGSLPANKSQSTVTFLKKYANTYINISGLTYKGNGDYANGVTVMSYNASTFKIINNTGDNSNGRGWFWRSCGYIAN